MTEFSRRDVFRMAGVVAGVTAAGFGAVGCSTEAPPRPVLTAADLDPLDLTVRMVRFDTSHAGDGGVTLPHAEMLKSVWDAAGARTEIIPTPKPDNAHFIARITGSGANRPLLLLGHSDVVGVERERWTADPYGGEIRDGWVYGRGTLDMKGANAAFVSALLRHVQEGARFDRDIIFLSDCDEEAGPHGTRWLAEQHYDKIDAGAVLTEGGWMLAAPGTDTPTVISIATLDKMATQIEVTAQGTATHSSRPSPDAAIVRLNRALTRLADYQPDVALTELTRHYFQTWAQATGNADLATALRLMLDATGREQRNRAGAMVVALSAHPTLHNALMRHIVTPVIQNAGYRTNVQPGSANAQVNLRIVPGGVSVAQTLAEIRVAAGDGVTIELSSRGKPGQSQEQLLVGLEMRMGATASTVDTDVYRALEAGAGETFPGVPVTPVLFEAGTSAGPWRQRGIPVYGIYPYVTDDDTLSRMHGNDERIRVDALRRGTEMMYQVFARFRA